MLGVDEDRVGSRVGIGTGPHQCLFLAPSRDQGFGASDHHELRIARDIPGSSDLPGMLLDRRQFAGHPGVETAPLGEDVVLDADRGDPCRLEVTDRVHGIDRVAKSRIDVRNDRNPGRLDHRPRALESLALGQNAGVGNRADGRETKAARPDRIEPRLCHQTGRERIMCATSQYRPLLSETPAQGSRRRDHRTNCPTRCPPTSQPPRSVGIARPRRKR